MPVKTLLMGLAAVLAVAANPIAPPIDETVGVRPLAARSGACTQADVNAVTVVIDFQGLGGGVQQYCASDLAPGTTGFQALQATGVSIQGTVKDGPTFVCRINSRPGPDQVLSLPNGQSYTESCTNTPPGSAYWSYWWATQGGSWTYSSQGSSIRQVSFGGYEGWSFALGGGIGQAPAPGVQPAVWAAPPVPEPPPASESAPVESNQPTHGPQPASSSQKTTQGSSQNGSGPSSQPGSSSNQDSQSGSAPGEEQSAVQPSASDQPSASVSPSASPTPSSSASASTTPATPRPSSSASADPDPDGSGPWGAIVGAGAILIIAAAAIIVGMRRSRRSVQ